MDFIRDSLREVIRVARPGAELLITPIYIEEDGLQAILEGFDQVSVKDLARLPGEGATYSRLVLQISK